MPIYEYCCKFCGHTLEALQGIHEDPLKDCPACKQAGLKKLISKSRFKLKGTGWYETDFKEDKRKKADAETLSDEKESSSGVTTAAEGETANTKTAQKSEEKSATAGTANNEGTSATASCSD